MRKTLLVVNLQLLVAPSAGPRSDEEENCPSEVRHRRAHPRSGEAVGTLGAALLRVIPQGECSNRRSPKRNQVPSRVGGAWQWSSPWRVKQGSRLSFLWKSTWKFGTQSLPNSWIAAKEKTSISELHEILCLYVGEGVNCHRTRETQTRTCNTTVALYTQLKQRRLHCLFWS